MKTRTFALPIALLALVACSAPVERSVPTTSSPPTLGLVQSVDDVQAALIEAGGDCVGDLIGRNRVVTAASSGECPGSGSVLTAYVDHDDAKAGLDGLFALDLVDHTVILGENWMVNPAGTDKEIVDQLAERMGGQVVSKEASSTTVPARPSASAEPYPTSGDYAADFAKLGIEVDDIEDHRRFVADDLCGSPDLEPDAIGPDSFKVMVNRHGKDDLASGKSPDLVRLVVAYDCPERAGLAEQYLEEES